ncbi:prostaglandin E2 receptor EP2 subtype-like [Episyrphus balteatus]|uniref:prostaglandin E2 receptor EP2 subtype-like n=1 Tax=Episyrphus balteatus TaxID=286459 RepID=UPI0024868785|nr:prostaglandin E2 receptor EP2 subtype-like [Episyrphus balteatus]
MDSQVFLKNDSSGVNANASFQSSLVKKDKKMLIAIIFVFLSIGILGNFLALVKLARKRRYNNGSYTLMLRCLTANNLIGLMGVSTMVIVKRTVPPNILLEYNHWFCASWVVFRFFGISSGCIAMIMSIDRYIILNHPVIYQEHFTRKFNRNAILALTLVAGIITFFPLFGFGIYFNDESRQCLRYREAKTLRDRAYAILFLVFGSLICITIVTCNTFVIRAILYKKRRRFSNSSSSSSQSSLTKALDINIKFSKLMAFLSLIFVICWMPQMISIVLALKTNPLPKEHWFFKLAEALIALLFTLDPYVYVLSGRNLLNCWCCRSKKSSSIQNQIRINNSIDCSL